jgi:hypothetical protein
VAPGGEFSYTGEKPGDKVPGEVYVDGVLDVSIHTSCSQPIGPGTKWGSFTVTGGASKKGGKFCDTGPACGPCEGGVTALTLRYDGQREAVITVGKPGKEVFRGTVAPGGEFSYTGEKPGDKVPGEVYVDGALDVSIHTSCSQPIGPGTKWGSFTVTGGASKKGGPFCGGTPPCTGPDCPQPCGECKGKVTTLTLRNDGAAAQVTVVEKDGQQIFAGPVGAGETFTFSGRDKSGTMGTAITVTGNGQATAIHTSCSQPIGVGLRFGPYTVVAGASLTGGAFCGAPPPPCPDCPTPMDCGPCKGKVTQLTLRYTGAGPTMVTVTAKKGGVIYNGALTTNDEFTFAGNDKDGTMGTEITVTANGQATAIHTSCSQPIGPGMTFGPYLVVAGRSLEGGPLCPDDGTGKTKSKKKSQK